MIYSVGWRSRKEIAAFDSLFPYWPVTVPRLKALADLPYTRMPTQSISTPLQDLCRIRGQQLAQLKVPLYVPLSGGVDSTMAAVATTLAGACPVVGVSQTGERHCDPRLLDWLEAHGAVFTHCNQGSLRNAYVSGLMVVTGTHGDNLFLGDLSFSHPELIETVWEMSPDELMFQLTGRHGVLNQYVYLFAEMPLPQTAPNLLWWISFCQRWHVDNFYMTADIGLGVPGVDHIHFFDTEAFQSWMMQDASVRCGRTYANHKDALGNSIRQMVGIDLVLPTKTQGWDDIRPMQGGKILAVDSSYHVIREAI